MLTNIGTRDMLGIWSELEQCWHGTNGFGSDTAEIYAFRIRRESTMGRLLGEDNSMGREAIMEDMRDAAHDLGELLALFMELRGCKIEVNDEPFDPKKGLEPFNHRVHVRVIPNEKRGKHR